MSRRILVTGGAGFLGSHLCARLLEEDCMVVALDNLFTGSRSNLESLWNHPNFEFIRHDVCEPITIDVEQVYHLACPASPVHYQRNPVRTIRTCVQGTLNMLDLAREVGARVLIASTSEIYGDPLVHPQVESYWGNVNPIGIRACYDEGKRCAEALAISYESQYGVEVRIPRIFNTYGPRMLENDGRVVSNFIVQCLRKQPITLFGDGKQTRSFCFVSDLIDGLFALMNSDHNSPMNLGNPNEFTVRELAEKVRDLMGATSEIIYLPLPKDDPTRRKPDISAAIKTLGWKPKVELTEGLHRTISHFKARHPRQPRGSSIG